MILICNVLLSQDTESNNSISNLWTSAAVNYKASKKLRFSFETQLRLKNEGKLYDAGFIELGGRFEIFKNLKLGVGYRFANKYDDKGKVQGRETHHRYQTYLSYKIPLKRYELSLRAQYQQGSELSDDLKFDDIISSDKQWLRFKSEVEYNIKKWKFDPKVGGEYFYRMNKEDDNYNKYRLFVGTNYALNGPHELCLKYIYENAFYTDLFITEHIMKLSYTYTIK